MFIGSIPNQVLEQAGRAVDFTNWKRAFVACSGSFKIERFLAKRCPGIEITGNDVSLVSCALGSLAAGEPLEFTFVQELEWLEPLRVVADPVGRVGLLMIALNCGTYATGATNRYKAGHLGQIKERAEPLAEAARAKIVKALDELDLVAFEPGDFISLALKAAEDGQGVVSFPPTYRGGYERQYRFLTANVQWPSPSYEVFNPSDLGKFVDRLDAIGNPWLIFTDQAIDDREPVTEFQAGRAKPIFGYSNSSHHAALTTRRPATTPFNYVPLDVSKLGPRSKVELVPATSGQASYIKDIYLAKNIKHAPGMANLLVYVDGMLAGLMIFALSRHQVYDPNEIYLLSDLSLSREGRISKLIARLATSKPVISWLESRFLRRFAYVVTTAFSKHPVSMKYRGVFDLLKRTETAGGFMLNYGKPTTREKVETIYRWWWREHGSKING